MGCGNSSESKPDEDGHHRRPKVSIRVGNQVERDKEQTQIVFVFGKDFQSNTRHYNIHVRNKVVFSSNRIHHQIISALL